MPCSEIIETEQNDAIIMGDKGVDPFDLVYSGKKKPQIIEPNNPQDCHESIDPAGNNFSNSASLYLLPSPKLEEMS